MDKKPLWVQFIQDTIGIPTCIGFILGVPAMITGIYIIWGSISSDQRIVVFVCSIVILIAIVLFIYDRVRKILYSIPPLLYQMRCRCMELAKNLTIDANANVKSLELLGTVSPEEYLNNIISNIKTKEDEPLSLDTIKPIVSNVMDSIKAQMKSEVTSDVSTIDRIVEYYNKVSGLDDLLRKDKIYCGLNKKLEKLRAVIPTEEISLAITKYLKDVKAFSSMMPTVSVGEGLSEILSLKSSMDLSRWRSNIDDELSKSLSKVREVIDKYYRTNK